MISLSKLVNHALLIAMLLHLSFCPYNKVEESFNIQATHDLLLKGLDVRQYDHLEFPGVVPRSFIGPLLLAILSMPLHFLLQLTNFSKASTLFVVRGILGLLVLLSFRRFQRTVAAHLGSLTANWLTIITCSQFHFLFYSSRTLPNIFALIFVLEAYSCWMSGKSMILPAGVAVIFFRFETCLLLGPLFAHGLCKHKRPLSVICSTGILGLSLLALSFFVDSFFWQRWTFPEAEVMWFNVIENKSSMWGTSPFHWYFTSVLPRALLTSLVFVVPGAVFIRETRSYWFPALLFMCLFSFLPHKELRFIIYTFPLLNTTAASFCAYLWQKRSRATVILRNCLLLHLLANLGLTGILLSISRWNYPGGEMMEKMHQRLHLHSGVNVHICNLAAQTGVNQFLQVNPRWSYNKTEDLESHQKLEFSHIIVEPEELVSFQSTHRILESTKGFQNLNLKLGDLNPVIINLEKKLFLLAKVQLR